MAYQFKNLVFEGGGVKGIAYVGAMEALAKKGILKNILRVGGTSAGAINAVLLGLNYSPAETREILATLNFGNFLDDSWGVAGDINRLINDFGWYKGDAFRLWIANLIKEKTGNSECTFSEFSGQKEKRGFRDIYFIGANLSTRFAEVFSVEHTPRMCIADAVRISMSIPLFFASKRSPRGDVYVDGGVLNNYPIKVFDREKYLDKKRVKKHAAIPPYYQKHNEQLRAERKAISPYCYNKETLGFRLDSAKEIAVFRDQAEPEHRKIDDFVAYAWALIQTIMEIQASMHLHGDDWQRTIYIDTLGVKTTDFDLSDEQKEALVESGRTNTEKYFAWYDSPKSRPANRP